VAGQVSISSIPCEIAYKYAGHIANPQNSATESPSSMDLLDVAAARVKRPVDRPEGLKVTPLIVAAGWCINGPRDDASLTTSFAFLSSRSAMGSRVVRMADPTGYD
jgi:hypothetical protein